MKNSVRGCSHSAVRALRLLAAISVLSGVSREVRTQTIFDREERQEMLLNDGWSYLERDLSAVDDVQNVRAGWVAVTLPHTWNRTDVLDQEPGYRRSAGWYRRELIIPPLANDLRILLHFEGVNITSDVYANGRRAGGHVGGYVGFTVDLTPLVHSGSNRIDVRVSNAYDPDVIPSQKSDFCIYGGITRNVHLLVVPSRFIEGVRISTPAVSKSSASTEIALDFRNERASGSAAVADISLKDPDGLVIARVTRDVMLASGTSTMRVKLADIRNPRLWSPSDPRLYTVDIRLREGDHILDRREERIGYRWYEFKEHGPFFLNGERMLLRGTHRHEDYAGYGNAVPDSLQRKDMVMIKDLGANFVRLAHYPQAPEVYRACDELGILVWDELPWCRGGVGGDVWKENTRRLLKEQILQNFNHPSIIIHSLGNEFSWLPDVPGGDDLDSLNSMLKSLNEIAHALDPSRLTATRKFTEGTDLVDVVSPSLWPGWYNGYFKGYEKALADSRSKYIRFFHAEYGGDSHVGRHSENPVFGDGLTGPDAWEEDIKPQKMKNVSVSGDWSESYIVNLFDWYLHVSEQTPWLTGNAQWAFKDFPTPLRPENPIPYMNQKGLVDRAGKPKDAYYVFKSYWTTSPSFCYIESHTWTERTGPAGAKRPVKVFSNCPRVELLLNGVSLGVWDRDIAKYPACGLVWDVPFAAGKNLLTAVGRKGAAVIAQDSMAVTYDTVRSGDPDHVELTSSRQSDGSMLITAIVVDLHGRRCLDYNRRIYFAHDGGGFLRENEGTPTRSSVIEMANGVARIEFVPEPGHRTVIEARNQDFKGAYLVFE